MELSKTFEKSVYLDYNATCPLRTEVKEAILDTLNEDDKDSWEVIMPGGIQIKCPHGLMFNSDQELSEDE